MKGFIDLFTQINRLYEQKAPSVALVENHELLCDLRDSGEITHNDFLCLENANRIAYDAYTRKPLERGGEPHGR